MESISDVIEDLGYIVGKWSICRSCNIVEDDRNRSTVGYICPKCGQASDGGLMYFEMSVHLTIDLIREAFLTEHNIENEGTDFEYQINTHYISVLIFFCTLREILLNNLIRRLCYGQNISEALYKRLTADNRFYIQKQNNLFGSLVGEKWIDALKRLGKENNSDYVAINEKVRDLVGLRNGFVHKGNGWGIDQDTATECVKTIEPLLHMYVQLHNEFVHKMYHS